MGAPRTYAGRAMAHRGRAIAHGGRTMARHGAPWAQRGRTVARNRDSVGGPRVHGRRTMAHRGRTMAHHWRTVAHYGEPRCASGAGGAPMARQWRDWRAKGAPWRSMGAPEAHNGAPLAFHRHTIGAMGAPWTRRRRYKHLRYGGREKVPRAFVFPYPSGLTPSLTPGFGVFPGNLQFFPQVLLPRRVPVCSGGVLRNHSRVAAVNGAPASARPPLFGG